ncbi:hypothetical protein ACTFIU_000094 [Dictyostelium citrinum]
MALSLSFYAILISAFLQWEKARFFAYKNDAAHINRDVLPHLALLMLNATGDLSTNFLHLFSQLLMISSNAKTALYYTDCTLPDGIGRSPRPMFLKQNSETMAIWVLSKCWKMKVI